MMNLLALSAGFFTISPLNLQNNKVIIPRGKRNDIKQYNHKLNLLIRVNS